MAENTPKGNYLKLWSIGVIYGAQCCAYCKNCGIVYGESDEAGRIKSLESIRNIYVPTIIAIIFIANRYIVA